MNKFLFALVTLVSVQSFAAGLQVSPTSYSCRGPDDTHFHYDTTSKIGKPLVSVTFQGVQAQLPVGGEIVVDNTRIGKLVTVTDNHLVPVDGPTIRYSIVLPNVLLDSSLEVAKFDTVVVRTAIANPFFHSSPAPVAIIENNEFENVQCVAQHVIF